MVSQCFAPFENSDRSVVRCHRPHSSHWWHHWCCHNWNTGMLYWSSCLCTSIPCTAITVGILNAAARWSFTLYLRAADRITDALATLHCCAFQSGSNIRSPCWHSEFFTEVHRRTLNRMCQYALRSLPGRRSLRSTGTKWPDQMAQRPGTPCQN